MAKLSALDVAKWLIMKNNENVLQYDDELLTHLKLQKLLYYAQGLYLAYTGKKLFSDDIHAWNHGPVVRNVWDYYNSNGSNGIKYTYSKSDSTIFEKISNKEKAEEVLETVYEHYGKYSAWKLRNMTHEESPWKNTNLNCVINESIIKKYFEEEVLQY